MKGIIQSASRKQKRVNEILEMDRKEGEYQNLTPIEFITKEFNSNKKDSLWRRCKRAYRVRKIKGMMNQVNEVEQLRVLYS